jgi:hypothetical protein
MTPHTARLMLTLECGSALYQLNLEPETELVDGVLVTPLVRHWLVFKFNSESGFAPCPEAFSLLVHASGANVVNHSDYEFEWMVEASGERFWAVRSGLGWLVDSCDGGGSHWYACDTFAMELALGLRTPSGHSRANRKQGSLRVAHQTRPNMVFRPEGEFGVLEFPRSGHGPDAVVNPSALALMEVSSHAAGC